ncbi:MAG TPA: hypothetical protein VIW45_07525 [Vicinamibacterales bacterium]
MVTLVMAAPVLRAPSERVFGMEIVGRHHDPFTVMEQFAQPTTVGIYSQPVTDVLGRWLAIVSGQVAAYNWLVLLSFPLSAAAAYMLARHLMLSPAAAGVAAMAYAFSPFHLAHAAYHPHVAQTQWIPLYLLALWRCLDRASPAAIGFLAMATVAVTLSNFYGGLIAAAMTPVAIAAYRPVRPPAQRTGRNLAVTIGAIGLLCAAGFAYAWWTARSVIVNPAAFAVAAGDAFRYSAKWWSYFVPPVAHPILGAVARRVWMAADVREGLLEQQVALGWAIVGLGVIAVACRLSAAATLEKEPPYRSRVPLLVIVGVAALACSLSPDRTIEGIRFVRPSALLHGVLPMFRAYARFGVVVQLMAALLAGVGIDCLRRSGTAVARVACVTLLVFAAAEYSVLPSALWRHALPTAAHRWVAQQSDGVRVLDCTPLDRESASVQWLTGYRVALLTGAIRDCTEPNLSEKLAAHGYSHLLLRRASAGERWFATRGMPDGFRLVADFADARVFAVTVPVPRVYTDAMSGFSPREHDADWTWRWMGNDAAWTIVNGAGRPIVAGLDVEVSAFHHPRRIELLLDGRHVQTLVVEPARRSHAIGAFTLAEGVHELAFHSVEAPTVAATVIGNGDPRALSFALGSWRWSERSEYK